MQLRSLAASRFTKMQLVTKGQAAMQTVISDTMTVSASNTRHRYDFFDYGPR